MAKEPIAITTDGEEFTIAVMPEHYIWKPRKDITAYELALALPVLVSHCYGIEQMMKDWPETVRRHFEEA